MGWAASCAIVLLSDLLGSLAFPPFRMRLLAFVFLAPFLLTLRRVGVGRGLFLAWLFAVGGAWALAWALPMSIARFYDRPLWVGIAMAVGIFTFMAAVYYMAFVPIYRVLIRRFHLFLPWLVGAAWVSVELARGRLFTGTDFFVGNPWGLLGYIMAGPGPMSQMASLTGVYGMTFVIVSANAGLVELWVAWRDRSVPLRRAGFAFGLAIAPAVLAFVYGTAVLRAAPPPSTGEGLVEVAVVQGHVSLGTRWRSDYYGRNLDIYLDLTERTFTEGNPAIVFWPEAAFTFFLEDEPAYRRAIGRILSAGDAELVAGGPRGSPGQEPPFYNSTFVIDPAGEVQARYDKQHLVPFTEFFPWQRLDLLQRDFEGARTFAHGEPGPPVPTRAGLAGILICNEAMLPEVASAAVQAGAEYLVNPSNDSWIADAGFAEHMFDVIALRAVEQRRYLVRASTGGPSGVVDPWGRVPVRTEPLSRQLLLGLIRPGHIPSLYGKVGDAFAWICVILTTWSCLVRIWSSPERSRLTRSS